MFLVWLILPLLLGGLLAWMLASFGRNAPRWIALTALAVQLAALLVAWSATPSLEGGGEAQGWLYELDLSWVPGLGIDFHLALDGLSLLLVLLTNVLGFVAVLASWRGIRERVGFFHFNVLWILAAITGVFLAVDLLLFMFFWEMSLVPLYLIIGIWGHENRVYATLKFFLFTQAGSLFMLISIVALYIAHGRQTGVYTFEYAALLETSLSPGFGFLLMLGFFAAFAVKLPLVPLHTWLPDAHTEAPTAGSVVLAGLVLKLSAYGFIRFMIPLFPEAAGRITGLAMILGVAGILYAAWVAYGQVDLKRMVAYTSVSHMGFVMVGIFAWNQTALQGALVIILAHGLSTGALFVLVGDLQDRMHTRSLERMGGLWDVIPRYGGLGMALAMASMALPGFANFVGEILVLIGVFQVSIPIAVLATLGFVASTVYSVWMIQAAFHGRASEPRTLGDAGPREAGILAVMLALLVWLGLFPQPVLNTSRDALERVQHAATPAIEARLGKAPRPRPQAGN